MSNKSSNIPLVPSFKYEQDLLCEGYDWVIGLDEVGRGSLAGPVMVGAAVIGIKQVKENYMPEGLADSKLLSEKRRGELYEPLQKWCTSWAVGSCTNKEIDEWGISYTLGVAALKAIAKVEEDIQISKKENTRIAAILDGPCDYIDKVANTFDAPYIPEPVKVHTLVKADRQCASVAAAAVLAKVTRDNLMVSLAKNPKYAAYDWASNKGYGSLAHRNAIKKVGPSDLHRLSWHL
ncbi:MULTISPECIES: ribonuclease HII [Gardnerella]|jgi:ribonuclease HII|uniref:Ribonuclease n=1 Tax=Gardnerella swidsinskii TaxID=2792979 RepID=A0A9X7FF92_9BIFI|nr:MULTISPECIES: ribonuclease HII [Gardnerella]APW18383.1 ribonuclease HII [Gardnerella vaginalis]NSX40587.1 ribonuclease HII [Gardnerella vaginalis]PMC50833.1 ribonuclease HII [Gardnerella vaginalis]PMC54106.1 ribonuclease HII [Gardnerella vaginalis]PMC55092.1 ribonuclease HII [Gardnerella swidsinskii]